MRTKAGLLVAALCAVAMLGTLRGQSLNGEVWTSTGTGTTLASVIAPPRGGERLLVSFVNATSDKAASVLQLFTAGAAIAPEAAAASQADVDVPDGTAFSGGNIVIFYDVDGDQVQRNTVASVATNTVTFDDNLTFALTANDRLYIMTAGGSVPVGAATKELNGAPGFVLAGETGKPFLLDLDGTSACTINTICGVYAEEP